jgi:hypothetical protein
MSAKTAHHALIWSTLALAATGVTACSAPSIAGFKIAVPASISVTPGESSALTVSATATSKTAVTAALVIYYLPAGVTANPAAPTVATGDSTTITLIAAPDAKVGLSSNVQITGYAGLASSTAFVKVNVVAAP